MKNPHPFLRRLIPCWEPVVIALGMAVSLAGCGDSGGDTSTAASKNVLLASTSVSATASAGDKIKNPDDARSLGLESLRLAIKNDGGVPLPSGLDEYIKDRDAAIQLGKALFWDQQVGADGLTACASCHFQAGTDGRATNALNPGLLSVLKTRDGDVKGYMAAKKAHDGIFNSGGLNGTLKAEDFPFVKNIQRVSYSADGKVLAAPGNSNDVVSSMGTFFTQFDGVEPGAELDLGTPLRHPIFHGADGQAVRQVGHRNTPSVINAVFNNMQFWDGHGNPFFNGQNQFGIQHAPSPLILVNTPGDVIDVAQIMLMNGSLAGQTSQPATEPHEMGFGIAETQNGRNLPQIGRKMLRANEQTKKTLIALARQDVSLDDSVLGKLSRYPAKGLSVDYATLIRRAFHDKYWNSPLIGQVTETETLTQMEANFALFFGLSIAMYESTLVSDGAPFDKWMETGKFNGSFDAQALKGLNVFVKEGQCISCHAGPELTDASIRFARNNMNLVAARSMAKGSALVDVGFHNLGVTPTMDDIGRGGTGFTGMPFSSARQTLLARLELGEITFPLIAADFLPAKTDNGLAVCDDLDKSGYCSANEPLYPEFRRVAVDGAFKTPSLRNAELTGPYFHNGGMATLRQAVQFFNRGGNFCDTNIDDLSPAMQRLNLSRQQEEQLVAFLVSLTDERVRYRRAPFDHPQLRLAAHGLDRTGTLVLDAVGATGASKPLTTFLNLNPQDAVFTPAGTCDPTKTRPIPGIKRP